MRSVDADYLIIGAGIVGLAVARELKRRSPGATVMILEKENRPGLHSSGRNSGVLHSGIYYDPGSNKARLCAQGARELAGYCQSHKLPIRRIGKLLLAVRSNELSQLSLLQSRGEANGVEVQRLDGAGIRSLEPEARSSGEALFIPSTSVVSPAAILEHLAAEVESMGVRLFCGGSLDSVDVQAGAVEWVGTRIRYGHAINTAGLHADKVAHAFGVGRRYTMMPFRGAYWKLRPEAGFELRHLIYPVPDFRVPFLGIHTTTALDGTIYIGPSAMPALGRENYRGMRGASIPEAASMMMKLATQFAFGHDGFRRLAWQESLRLSKRQFAKSARCLLPRLEPSDLLPCDKVGIRAQILDLKHRRLVHDFLVEKGKNSTHLLNAISPAFTSAFPLAREVCDRYLHLMKDSHGN